MCGIAGLIESSQNNELLVVKVEAMISELFHRGPDSGATWIEEEQGLVLGHRRLAIQDLSEHGKQPMISATKRFVTVFNGEIYNFKEITVDLCGRGYKFTGHSDTEVLLAAIETWGLEDAVKKFTGMFAFALWDSDTATLHLCRDRLGEKPLYYGWLGNVFYFASELKAIEKIVPKDKLSIDYDGLSGFLKYGYISAPYSIYRHIYKLMPGTIFTIPVGAGVDSAQFSPWADDSSFSPDTYWSVLDSANQGRSNLIHNEEDAIQSLDSVLHQSVRRQMISDVKVGAFLSGGIDSTVVSAIAQQEASENVRTYTIGFDEKEYDESLYAEKIARHLGTEHLTMRVTSGDVINVVPQLASIYDEPFADSSQIPSYLVSKLACEHVTVCLSGDGGDELFAGYNRYLWTKALWGKLDSVPYRVKQVLGKAMAIPSPTFWDRLYLGATIFSANSYKEQKLIGLKVQKLAGFMQQQDIYKAYDYLVSYWAAPEDLIMQPPSSGFPHDAVRHCEADDFIDQAMYLDQVGYLPGDNLAKVDRASMAVSLETRLPLLSHDVVDLAWRIPASMKVKGDVSKWVLRQVLYKYVPQEMIDRPKMGFSVPVAKWLRNELRVWAEDLLATLETSAGGVLRKQPFLKAWEEHLSGQRDHSHRLWTVLMFLSWLQERN
jgi:asparagine synthase (glutamine-hydrolysing)